MTPMIDVVFQLIIFFLLASHLGQQESQLELQLPEATTGEKQSLEQSRRVTIQVTPLGELIVGGATRTRDELAQTLEFELSRVGKDLEVRVRADKAVAYRVVAPVLQLCGKLGIWKVTLVVARKE